MNYYMAPMEGITGYVFRNAYHAYFRPMDKYFTPFISPNQNACFTPKEYRDIIPGHNRGLNVIPQILTNCAAYFKKTVHELSELGYEEVNLNLGCPSGTVVSKQKGAGFLKDTERLGQFLDEIFEASEVKISVKTRLGLESTEEFPALLEIFNRYPLKELIIHPRIRQEFYSGSPHWEVFAAAEKESRNPLCYNGDLFSVKDIENVCREPDERVQGLMFGRGILKNPGLLSEYEEGIRADAGIILEFSERLFSDYKQLMGEHNALFKMKELWLYLAEFFIENESGKENGGRNISASVKKIKKAGSGEELRAAVRALAH